MLNKLNEEGGDKLRYKIKECCEELKMSQVELSEKSRVSRTILSGLESGTISVTTKRGGEKEKTAISLWSGQ